MLLSSSWLGRGRSLALIALLVAVPAAHAQGVPERVQRADPLDPQARVPALRHLSSLAGYRRLGDAPPIGWKDANETVNRIGGWRAYAREAQQAEPAASAPAPARSGHQKH